LLKEGWSQVMTTMDVQVNNQEGETLVSVNITF